MIASTKQINTFEREYNMILADKIIKLRKQFAWSQEELAEKMGVSRQSVSKWESANSIPDLNKIIKLGEIFGVSTDYLLKDEIDEVESITEETEPGVVKVTLDRANQYIDDKLKSNRIASKGVTVILSAIMPLFFLLGLSGPDSMGMNSNVAVASGLVVMLLMVGMAVSIFIRSSHYEEQCKALEDEDFELVYGVRSIFKERLDQLRPMYQTKVSLSVMLFITCPLPLIVVAIMGGSNFTTMMMVIILLLMLIVGLNIIIPVSAEYGAYQRLVGEGEYSPKKKDETKRTEKVAAFYWPLVTAVYLGWSFLTMDWGTTWIVWPVAGVLFAAVLGMASMFGNDK